jgi:hypothetical protein
MQNKRSAIGGIRSDDDNCNIVLGFHVAEHANNWFAGSRRPVLRALSDELKRACMKAPD